MAEVLPVILQDAPPEKTNSPLKFDKPRDHCLGEKLTYTNLNNKSIYILSPSEELEEIGSSDKTTLPLYETGRYQIGILNKDQTFVGSESFNVSVAKQLQINTDDYLNFESGLPVLNVQALTEKEVQWLVNGKKIQENGNSNSCLLFDKGNYNIKASYKDGNGCQSTDEISFFVEKNYNLLAVNAFTPNSSDHRNNTFMPFALTKRDVAFNMIIIDPTNGAVIFKSSNAGQPWKGINKNTGDLVEENKPFCGVDAQLAFIIQDQAFDYLDAPIKRISAIDAPQAYSKALENIQIPDHDRILAKAMELV